MFGTLDILGTRVTSKCDCPKWVLRDKFKSTTTVDSAFNQ